MQLADGTYLSFRYNDEGVRTRKTVNGVETYFYLDGTNILAQKTGNDILWFNYDANGTRISITMPNGAVYYYAYNAQGDVIGLYSVNQYGYFVPQVYYTYDAWGKVLSISGNMADTLGQQNPFRYRGYYYDSETQFYYLNSRYYDPEVGRFINTDHEIAGTNGRVQGYNLFSYCFNNPVNLSDPAGNWPQWLTGAINVVSGALSMAAGVALGATVGWTGFGAVVAGFLFINGAATITQGVGQIVNDVTGTNYLREDNIIRTGVQDVGRAIGGDTGASIAGFAYDAAETGAAIYGGGKITSHSMPKIVNSKLFSANNGYGFKIGKTANPNYGRINLLYQNPSFETKYGVKGGTFISTYRKNGERIFRIDWDPKDGLHIH